jgi:hypothetical protein
MEPTFQLCRVSIVHRMRFHRTRILQVSLASLFSRPPRGNCRMSAWLRVGGMVKKTSMSGSSLAPTGLWSEIVSLNPVKSPQIPGEAKE